MGKRETGLASVVSRGVFTTWRLFFNANYFSTPPTLHFLNITGITRFNEEKISELINKVTFFYY